MNVDYSGYEGWEVTGKVKTVLLRGKVAIDNNHCNIDKGYGKFIKRSPYPLKGKWRKYERIKMI